jgi:hypothetical protein
VPPARPDHASARAERGPGRRLRARRNVHDRRPRAPDNGAVRSEMISAARRSPANGASAAARVAIERNRPARSSPRRSTGRCRRGSS